MKIKAIVEANSELNYILIFYTSKIKASGIAYKKFKPFPANPKNAIVDVSLTGKLNSHENSKVIAITLEQRQTKK